MTEEEVIKLAEAVAAQRLVFENLSMMNRPSKAEDRVRLDAQHMIARDKLLMLEKAYQCGLNEWVTSYSQPDRKVGNEGEKS